MGTESNKEYSVNWKNHMSHVRKAFDHLLNTNELTDVTLYCDRKKIGAHKMLLSACSTYFRDVFKEVPCQHPVIIMQGIEYGVLSDILHFIYNGEVNVDTSKLDVFLKSAQMLQINGLTDGVSVKEETVEEPSNNEEEETFVESMTRAVSINDNERKMTKRGQTDNISAQNSKRQREEEESFFVSDVKCEPSELMNFEDPLQDPLIQNEQAGTQNPIDEDYRLHLSEEIELSDDATNSNDIPLGLLEDVNAANNSVIPIRSKVAYEKSYLNFREWCSANGVEKICEDVVLAFLEQKSKLVKPLTLWSTYSMLKAMLIVKDGIDLRRFPKLIPFLKRKNVGYLPKKTALLTKEEIDKFINEADDKIYLLIKTVLIMGIAGACRRDELVKMTIDSVEDVGHILIVKVLDTKTNLNRTFMVTNHKYIDIYRRYRALRPAHATTDRLFLKYMNGKCVNSNVGINKIGEMPSIIARFLGRKDVKNFTAHCFRRSSTALATSKRHQGLNYQSST